jgi:hypothetical protein
MFIHWKTRRTVYKCERCDSVAMCTRREAVQLSAELRESAHVDGNSRVRFVSTLGSIDVIYLEAVSDVEQYNRPRQRWHWHERRERVWRNAAPHACPPAGPGQDHGRAGRCPQGAAR